MSEEMNTLEEMNTDTDTNTWLREFYPTRASKFHGAEGNEAAIGALEHSIKKWTGLMPENKAKYNVELGQEDGCKYAGPYILHIKGDTGKILLFGDESCALCQLSCRSEVYRIQDCDNCCVKKYTGKTCIPVYEDCIAYKDGTQMVELLEFVKGKVLEDTKSAESK